jgi:pseudouridine-5'-phosphate glycosidase
MRRLDIHPEVEAAQRENQAVVALESTLIAHGLPWPLNLETARQAEQAVRDHGAVPATVAVIAGRPTIGLTDGQLEAFAREPNVLKASTRDLASAISQKRTAATTVSATMRFAHAAGISLFATGGIGGVHRGDGFDVSADLFELSRTPVAVACAGAKSILDLPQTLEVLETFAVPVVGYRTDIFPAFYVESSGERVSARVNTPTEAATLLSAHWDQLSCGGIVLAQPLPADVALSSAEFEAALQEATVLVRAKNIRGKEVTPFLLARLAEITNGKTLRANQALIVANAALAAQVAVEFVKERSNPRS